MVCCRCRAARSTLCWAGCMSSPRRSCSSAQPFVSSMPSDWCSPIGLMRRVRGNVAVVRGGIRYFTGDLAQTVSLMQQALALLPELPMSVAAGAGSARARAVAAVGAARAYKLTGDVTEASERQATAAIPPARATGYVTETIHSYTPLASPQVLQGRLHAAR